MSISLLVDILIGMRQLEIPYYNDKLVEKEIEFLIEGLKVDVR